jgi:uncharacterized membrane protein
MRRPKAGLLVIAAMVIFSVAVFGMLPDRGPGGWGAGGAVGRGGSRLLGAAFGPAMALAVWALLRGLTRFAPKEGFDQRFWDTYWIFGNSVVALLAVLHVLTLGAALGWPMDASRLVPAAMGLAFLGLGRWLPRVRPNGWLGIRTPWTLASERVWRATHRLAGKTFTVGGILTLTAIVAPAEARPSVALAGLGIGGFIPILYSFFARRREERAERA